MHIKFFFTVDVTDLPERNLPSTGPIDDSLYWLGNDN